MKKKKMREGFAKKSVIVALEKTCKILSRRIGKPISFSPLPMDVVKATGEKLTGCIAIFGNKSQIRFNWKTRDMSCEIVSVDYWTDIKKPPAFSLDTQGNNIIQIIDAIVYMIVNKTTGKVLTEDVVLSPTTKGNLSKEIADSITKWSQDMSIDPEEDLKNRRISELYNNYLYWYKETGLAGETKLVSLPTFRSYILKYLEKYGISNIHMRSTVIKDGTKEKIVVTDTVNETKFDEVIYKMSLKDKVDFAKRSISIVLQGLQNALIIGGQAGVGKSRLIKETVYASNKKVIYETGAFKTPFDLYKFFYKYRDKNNVIVFDDTDSVFEKKMLDIMKAATSPDRERFLSYYSDTKTKGIDTTREYGVDIEKGKVKGIPPRFKFEASIIIATNKPKRSIDSAILSRGAYIEFHYSVQDLIDAIRVDVESIFADLGDRLTTEMKMDVLDFVQKYQSAVFQFDYRTFQIVCSYRCAVPPDPLWRKHAMEFLRVTKK